MSRSKKGASGRRQRPAISDWRPHAAVRPARIRAGRHVLARPYRQALVHAFEGLSTRNLQKNVSQNVLGAHTACHLAVALLDGVLRSATISFRWWVKERQRSCAQEGAKRQPKGTSLTQCGPSAPHTSAARPPAQAAQQHSIPRQAFGVDLDSAGQMRTSTLPTELLTRICDAVADDQSSKRFYNLLHLGLSNKQLWSIVAKCLYEQVNLEGSDQVSALIDRMSAAKASQVRRLRVSVHDRNYNDEGSDGLKRLAQHLHLIDQFEISVSMCDNLSSVTPRDSRAWLPPRATRAILNLDREPSFCLGVAPMHSYLTHLEYSSTSLVVPVVAGLLSGLPALRSLRIAIKPHFMPATDLLACVSYVAVQLRDFALENLPSQSVIPDGRRLLGSVLGLFTNAKKLEWRGRDLTEACVEALTEALESLVTADRFVEWEALCCRLEAGQLANLRQLTFLRPKLEETDHEHVARKRLQVICQQRNIRISMDTSPPPR